MVRYGKMSIGVGGFEENEVPETFDSETPEPQPESRTSVYDAALKMIAGQYAGDIRQAVSEEGLDYEEVTDVKNRILAGTYF